ncbi:hypothetical protein BB559_002037 [Furculomyces boomerangus]|uniref:DUF962 domain-containing protein n=2 Tax=Harpellales TaxID=61421 RepID=A0A2T9YYK2_9FUNG|nr:hypothetical protein BB559_002037 [Furculomyces boomerangus]PVZ96967.1 hypothetical protein BB558_007093 [Smittium angustum]PVZ98244.1 hypothetical protein BB558_005754 [Smittium angustum]PWA01596.1 hypothetical protein BB558_002295 [Smittium angustum]
MLANPDYKKVPYSINGYRSFAEFYPFYLGEHRNKICRRLHVVGTLTSTTMLSYFVSNQMWSYIPLSIVTGYAFAWAGHFLFEKNKPATFKHPFYSFAGDMRLAFEVATLKRPF